MTLNGTLLILLLAVTALFPGRMVSASPSRTERLAEDVYLVRDDAGNWGGPGLGMTHQRGADYQARKILDLSAVPEKFWEAVLQVRLSAFFCVRDYSWHDAKQVNGLDEAIEIVVNGKVHRKATNAGLPVYQENQPMERAMQWHNFELSRDLFVRGPNEIVFRLAPLPGKEPDDYLYLGIDNTVPGGHSSVRFSRTGAWQQDKLNGPGGKGEYMVRLYLLTSLREFQAVWMPLEKKTEDPQGMILYSGTEGDDARMEWDPRRLDRLMPVTVEVDLGPGGEGVLEWLDEKGNPVKPEVKGKGPRLVATLKPPMTFVPGGVRLDKTLKPRTVTLKASRGYQPLPRTINMAPCMASPRGKAVTRVPSCRMDRDQVELANGTLRCRFGIRDGKVRLESLYNELAKAEMVRRSEDCALFLLEKDGQRYAGSRYFVCRSITPLLVTEGAKRIGFTATLVFPEIKGTGTSQTRSQSPLFEAVLTVWINDALRMGLTITNRSDRPVDFKIAFPHLAGLAISEKPADDYYFFPWGGGIVADVPAVIRRGYGDHEAIYQMMDIFSPGRGAGFAIACTDEDGRHKVLALRKYIPGQQEISGDSARTPTAEEYQWTNSLPAVQGMGVTFEYLRRTRKPGESFTAKEAAFTPHAGDWHEPMKAYADWCHRVWKFRAYPSRLEPVVNMIAAGWGQDALFREGKYRTDFLRPQCDCIELMSWWEWSPLGPQGIPLDQFAKKMGEAKLREWEPYFAKDPVTGRLMFSNNPGDCNGYNERFGGLPVFRKAIQAYRKTGTLVTLYTDPLRVDDNTKCGRQWGKLWGVVQPDGRHRRDYDAWRMCHDVADYRRWVAETVRRVIRETGADGVRLDEYGHCGSACGSTLHPHTFAEPGITEWQRAIAETTRLVRQAMDEVNPGSVLTTEHPGYDFLLPWIEGCITYDLSVQATPLRPLECNMQRFYFPECKAFELVFGEAQDPGHRKRFWNSVASFGSFYPAKMDRLLRQYREVFSSRDCMPLVPTLARLVYANRFRAGDQTIYTLYNARGHTFAGPVLSLDLKPGEHVIDLFTGRKADCRTEGGKTTVRMYLPRDQVTCLLCGPTRLRPREIEPL